MVCSFTCPPRKVCMHATEIEGAHASGVMAELCHAQHQWSAGKVLCGTHDVLESHLLAHEQLCVVPLIMRGFIEVPAQQKHAHACHRRITSCGAGNTPQHYLSRLPL